MRIATLLAIAAAFVAAGCASNVRSTQSGARAVASSPQPGDVVSTRVIDGSTLYAPKRPATRVVRTSRSADVPGAPRVTAESTRPILREAARTPVASPSAPCCPPQSAVLPDNPVNKRGLLQPKSSHRANRSATECLPKPSNPLQFIFNAGGCGPGG